MRRLNEDFYAKSDQIAQKYLSAREKIGSIKGKDFTKTQDTISKLEKAKQNLSETSLLWTRLEEQITELKKQTEKASELENEFDATKREFLELTAASFEIDPRGEKSLSQSYIKALTDALFRKEKIQLEFHECLIKPRSIEIQGDETRNLIVCANISAFVQDAAKQVLGKGTMLKELWNRIINAEAMFKVYSILATNDRNMTAMEIASLINEGGWNRVKVKNTLVNLLLDDLFPQKLIRRVDEGKYQVSDVGRFLWLEFGPSKEEAKERSVTSSPRNLSQTALNKWSES
jgi:hypothetical protein